MTDKRWLIGALLAALCVGAPPARGQGPLTPKQVYEKAKDSVVQIETDDGVGTGFFFKNSSFVATCFHVIKGAKKITVHGTNGAQWKVESVYFDAETDAAVLKISGAGPRAPLPSADLDKVSPGDPVLVLGHSLGFDTQSLTSGIVSAKREVHGHPLIQMTAAISPGSSGSPVLSDQGEVLGFVSFTFAEGQSLNMAMGCSSLIATLKEAATPVSVFLNTPASRAPATEGGKKPDPAERNEGLDASALTERYTGLFTRVHEAMMLWDIELYKASAKLPKVPLAAFEAFDRRAREVRGRIKDFKEFANSLSEATRVPSAGWRTKLLTALSALEKATLVREKTTNEHYRKPPKEKAAEDASIERVIDARIELEEALHALLTVVDDEGWFDEQIFADGLNPGIYMRTIGPSLEHILPNPLRPQEARIGFVFPAAGELEIGDVVTGVRAPGKTEFLDVVDWADLSGALLELLAKDKGLKARVQAKETTHEVLIRFERDGKSFEITASFTHD